MTVKEAPTAASPIADISSLTARASQEISLWRVFSDGDGNALTLSASSSDTAVATDTVSDDSLTVRAVSAGTATITVTAQDADGNQVSDTFDVTVNAQPDVIARYDANKDGVISLSEFLAAISALYKDVTLDELIRIRQAWADGGHKQ